MAKEKFYDVEPHVPADKIADQPNIQNASLGNEAPNMVPKAPGKIRSLGPPHGFGHAGSQKLGKTRLSGHPQAHRLGGKMKIPRV